MQWDGKKIPCDVPRVTFMKLGVSFPPIIADDINFHIYDGYVKVGPGDIYMYTQKPELQSRI